MDFLARREYARAELCRKLVATGFDAAISADAVERLADEGLQCDRRFVEAFVRSRIGQGKGRVRIRSDLGQRGIDEHLLEAAIDEIEQDWYALARQVRLQKFGADVPSDFRSRARQMRFLQSRGFETGEIRAAMLPGEA